MIAGIESSRPAGAMTTIAKLSEEVCKQHDVSTDTLELQRASKSILGLSKQLVIGGDDQN